MADEAAAPADETTDAADPNKAPGSGDSAISDEEVSALLEGAAADNVRPFDLTAQRINRTQLPMLETVCRSFAEKIGPALSALVGRDANVAFAALESAKASELQAALPVPASLVTVRLKPLVGNVFVSIEPNLLLALLDGFFGGPGRAVSDSQAAVAPAAQRFLALLLRNFASPLTAAWAPVAAIEMEIVKQETNPRLMHLGTAQELLLALRFNVEFGPLAGRMSWLIPEATLAPIREVLASDSGTHKVSTQPAWAPVLSTALQEAELEARAILAEARISLGELVRLTPGDIIPIDTPQHATLLAGEVPIHRGRFGVSQGRNALKIIHGGSR